MKSFKDWQQDEVDDGDKIKCRICGGEHLLVQGELNEMRIGDGVLFYTCDGQTYIGAINKHTVFGVEICR
jgi:hypothetical protein